MITPVLSRGMISVSITLVGDRSNDVRTFISHARVRAGASLELSDYSSGLLEVIGKLTQTRLEVGQ